MDKLASDLHHRHGLPTKLSILKKFGDQLEIMFNQQFSTSLSYHDIHRTRRDLRTVLSIQRKLKKLSVIIRRSDKSDYDRKVLDYQEKTEAYVKLSSNPLIDTFYKVTRLLNDLTTKKQIKPWQYKKMMPDQKKIQLAYLYFIPKPHKVKYEITSAKNSYLIISITFYRKAHHYDQLFHRFMHQRLAYPEC